MFPYVVGGLVGAFLMGKTKPKMPMKLMTLYGPRTGTIWTAEVFPGDDVVALHAPGQDNTIALFRRAPSGTGFVLLHAFQGYPETVQMMQKDLEA
jgi:hypothetical protein